MKSLTEILNARRSRHWRHRGRLARTRVPWGPRLPHSRSIPIALRSPRSSPASFRLRGKWPPERSSQQCQPALSRRSAPPSRRCCWFGGGRPLRGTRDASGCENDNCGPRDHDSLHRYPFLSSRGAQRSAESVAAERLIHCRHGLASATPPQVCVGLRCAVLVPARVIPRLRANSPARYLWCAARQRHLAAPPSSLGETVIPARAFTRVELCLSLT